MTVHYHTEEISTHVLGLYLSPCANISLFVNISESYTTILSPLCNSKLVILFRSELMKVPECPPVISLSPEEKKRAITQQMGPPDL